jgi:uncharacterized protein YecE (DUF72 family)
MLHLATDKKQVKRLLWTVVGSIFVGTGGWAYLNVGRGDRLKAYSRLFNFVEVNSTFYSYMPLKVIRSWRFRVPTNFIFSVRCHRDLTHKFRLEPREESYEVFNKMVEVCKVLGAPIMHLQTPEFLEMDRFACRSARDLLSSVALGGVRIALEVRGGLSKEVINLMMDLNLVPCVDLSRGTSPFQSDILYTRLFGKGYHTLYEFDDDELIEIEEKVKRGNQKQAFLVFHSLKMYEDAQRLKIRLEKGIFPQSRRSVGLEALTKLLSEVLFPCSKDEVVKKVGWRSIDTTSGRRIHVSRLLEKIPAKIYLSVDDVVREVSLYSSFD